MVVLAFLFYLGQGGQTREICWAKPHRRDSSRNRMNWEMSGRCEVEGSDVFIIICVFRAAISPALPRPASLPFMPEIAADPWTIFTIPQAAQLSAPHKSLLSGDIDTVQGEIELSQLPWFKLWAKVSQTLFRSSEGLTPQCKAELYVWGLHVLILSLLISTAEGDNRSTDKSTTLGMS